jgi:hypothetical protein
MPFKALLLLFCAIGFETPTHAQVAGGSLSDAVTGQPGAVPGVSISVQDIATGASRTRTRRQRKQKIRGRAGSLR